MPTTKAHSRSDNRLRWLKYNRRSVVATIGRTRSLITWLVTQVICLRYLQPFKEGKQSNKPQVWISLGFLQASSRNKKIIIIQIKDNLKDLVTKKPFKLALVSSMEMKATRNFKEVAFLNNIRKLKWILICSQLTLLVPTFTLKTCKWG